MTEVHSAESLGLKTFGVLMCFLEFPRDSLKTEISVLLREGAYFEDE